MIADSQDPLLYERFETIGKKLFLLNGNNYHPKVKFELRHFLKYILTIFDKREYMPYKLH